MIYRMNTINLVLIVAMIGNTMLLWAKISPLDEVTVLYVLLLLSFSNYGYTIYVGAREMAAALNISIFSVKRGQKVN
jgi:hypothetical protein